jgi:hypothetical protein
MKLSFASLLILPKLLLFILKMFQFKEIPFSRILVHFHKKTSWNSALENYEIFEIFYV